MGFINKFFTAMVVYYITIFDELTRPFLFNSKDNQRLVVAVQGAEE